MPFDGGEGCGRCDIPRTCGSWSADPLGLLISSLEAFAARRRGKEAVDGIVDDERRKGREDV